MKGIYSILLFLLVTSGYAQDKTLAPREKGLNLIGSDVTWLAGSSRINFLNLSYGRFVANKLVVGLEVELAVPGIYYKAIMGEPYARYYLLNTKFTPFAAISYGFGGWIATDGRQGSDKTEWNGITQKFNGELGISYAEIVKRLDLEIFAGYSYIIQQSHNHPVNGEMNNGYGIINYGLRINYRIK